ncbi:EamA family transporter [Gleimia sp. 6138-11-ORH1]|uniref:EamA family transporter n=1 Tax=Gleimia sp. 6138-11-ORH1 TaxID=2973937 RepID=UPI002166D4F6|nr:EamA family transporter [Gleimia sp. 6138-11-ORH1]MCS4484693.1 EamA family transporter [Gleimia sp. 6138-11-ORH1]
MLSQILSKTPAPLLFIFSGLTQYVGAAVAVGVFASLSPAATAWWRFALAGVVLFLWQRPWQVGYTLTQLRNAIFFGLIMAGMNIVFYEALARIDLGVVVSLEFLGPVAVAISLNRSQRARIAAFLALFGVVSISGFALDLSAPEIGLGLFFSFLAGALWAGYIILGKQVSAQGGLHSLAIGAFAAAIAYAPFGLSSIPTVFQDGQLFLALGAVALFSTLIPYSLDQIILRRLDAPTFSLLNALLPASSMVIGVIVLQQIPTLSGLIGLILISISVWLATSSQSSAKPKEI